jgi:hypothetical protein
MATKIRGREALIARMRGIPAPVRIAARDALARERVLLEEQIRSAAPRDHGDLAASVRSYDVSSGEKISAVVTAGETEDPEKKYKARAIEFGRPDMEAQPFFFPTYRAFKRPMKARVSRAIKTALKKYWS